MKLQTYFLEKAHVAFSDFLSTGRHTKEKVVQRDPWEPRTEARLLLCLIRPASLPHLLSSFPAHVTPRLRELLGLPNSHN